MIDSISMQMFLNTLFKYVKSSKIEIRAITNEGHVISKFFNTSELDKIARYAGDLNTKSTPYNVYFGVLPRKSDSGKDDSIKELQTFWVDIDAKDFNNDKQVAKDMLNKFPLKPTIVIDSGHGYHAYWLLNDVYILNTKDKIDEAVKVSKAVHKMVGGDHTHNLSRILRLPGTFNVKKEPKILCTMVEYNPTSIYSLGDIKSHVNFDVLAAIETSELELNLPSRVTSLDTLKSVVPLKVLERARKAPITTDRSANDFWIAVQLYESQLNDAEVYDAFKLFIREGWDAGQKASITSDYLLKHTLPVAKQSANQLEMKLELLENAKTRADKLYITELALPLIAKKHTIEQELYLQRIQEILGGKKSIPISLLKNQMKISQEDNDGPLRFFELANNSKTFIPKLLGEYLLQTITCMTLNGKIYTYNHGVFKPNGDEQIVGKIKDLLLYEWRSHYRDETIEWIKDSTNVSLDQLPKTSEYLNVLNGMLHLKTNVLYSHDPKYKSTIQVNVKYDPTANYSRLDAFMHEVFEQECIDTMWEIAGYPLIDLELKKFVIYTGKGNNGKSVWLSLINDVLGEENVSNEPLHKLANNNFAAANLFGKIANINADLESADVKQTGIIKMLTGGDKIAAEVKYGDTFYYRNRARLMFSCNELPAVQDYNDAYFDRLIIVKCNRQFGPDKADPNLLNKLTSDYAKSAFLNRALEGAKRLLTQNRFTKSSAIDSEVLAYRYSSDSVSEFIQSAIAPQEGNAVSKDRLYAAYKNWCYSNGRVATSSKTFSKRAIDAPNYLIEGFAIHAGDRVGVWKDIALKINTGSADLKIVTKDKKASGVFKAN